MTKKSVDYKTYAKAVLDIVNGYFYKDGVDDNFHFNAAYGRNNTVKVFLEYFWENDELGVFTIDDLENEKKFNRLSEHVNSALREDNNKAYLSFANAVKDAKETVEHCNRLFVDMNTMILFEKYVDIFRAENDKSEKKTWHLKSPISYVKEKIESKKRVNK